jgi:hypothetical protein
MVTITEHLGRPIMAAGLFAEEGVVFAGMAVVLVKQTVPFWK